LSRAPARRRAGRTRGDSVATGSPARADAARRLLGRPFAGRDVHRPRLHCAPREVRHRRRNNVIDWRDAIIDIAHRAGDAIMAVYRREDFDIETKGDNSPLTAADL